MFYRDDTVCIIGEKLVLVSFEVNRADFLHSFYNISTRPAYFTFSSIYGPANKQIVWKIQLSFRQIWLDKWHRLAEKGLNQPVSI
jgi:hypothetical protein